MSKKILALGEHLGRRQAELDAYEKRLKKRIEEAETDSLRNVHRTTLHGVQTAAVEVRQLIKIVRENI